MSALCEARPRSARFAIKEADRPVRMADKYDAPLLTADLAPVQFHVMAKPVGSTCNLACTYCFYLNKAQNPIATLQGHVSYNLTLRAWAAFDATWYIGGHAWMNGTPRGDAQNNSRLGATLSFPFGQRYSVKAAYSWDLSTAASTQFNTLSIGWNVAWFAPKVWR